MMTILTRLRLAVIHALKADEDLNDARGWTFNLGIFRIVFLGFVALPWALVFLSWTEKILPGVPREMWVPVSFYHLLPVGFLGNVSVARGIAIADIFLIGLGIVGCWTRWSIAFATLISLYGFGLMQNLGKVDHFHHVLWFMALLAAGPSGHFLSIDSIRRAIKNADEGIIETSCPSSVALWTFRYTWLLMGVLYLGTGIAKLQSALSEHWASSANLRNIMWRKWLELYWYDPHFVRQIRADLLPTWILTFLGATVVAFEIGFIFLVLFRRVRPGLSLWGLAFHIGNGLALNIWFTTLMWAYVCLFDWTAMGRAIARRGRDPLLVLYDGGCKLCRRTIAILKTFDLFDGLRPVAGQSSDPARNSYPQISDEMLTRDMYAAAEGRVAAGYDAYVWIAKRLFLFWPIAATMRLSPVAALGRRVYRGISDSRHCALATPELKQRAPVRRPEITMIHRLGLMLIVCQLGISGVMLLYGLRNIYSPPKGPWLRFVEWRIDGIGKRKPVWPFDLYPTFASATPSTVETWEPRWVTSTGREVRISPTAYFNAFDSSSLTWNITTGMLAEEGSQRGLTRSLDLVRLLWRNELPDIRRSVTAVNIYRTEYRLQSSDNAPAALLGETLLHTFPLKFISEDGTSSTQAPAPAGLNSQWIAFNRAGGPNSDLQCFTPDNVSVSGGNLVITTKSENSKCRSFDLPYGSHNYTSGYVSMRNFHFLYGIVEFRAKFGGGMNTGAWPAVWMADSSCQASDPTGTDDNCNGQEIDIAEIEHSNFTLVSQLIHVNNNTYHDGCRPYVTDASQDFHIYQLVWAPGSLIFKIDSKTTCTITKRYVPNAPMYLKIDMYVGQTNGQVGPLPSSVNNASLPWTTLIDYVHVTQGSQVIFNDEFDGGVANQRFHADLVKQSFIDQFRYRPAAPHNKL